jgi:hypothetical protein
LAEAELKGLTSPSNKGGHHARIGGCVENKLRKHRKQMTQAEIEYIENLVHNSFWRIDAVFRGHMAKRGRNFTNQQLVHACKTGHIIEVNDRGRVLMRDSLGVCVVLSIKDRLIFTAYANDPKDTHDYSALTLYTWKVDVISYLRGL